MIYKYQCKNISIHISLLTLYYCVLKIICICNYILNNSFCLLNVSFQKEAGFRRHCPKHSHTSHTTQLTLHEAYMLTYANMNVHVHPLHNPHTCTITLKFD